MASPVKLEEIPSSSESFTPEPFHSQLGPYVGRALSDHFDLTSFGVSLETLPPGSQSALRHWHTKNDEFVWMVEGELTLITNDGEALFTPGMCVGFKAGVSDGHHLVNRSNAEATFLVVGSRSKDDDVSYPDDDFQWLQTEDGRFVAARKDGTHWET